MDIDRPRDQVLGEKSYQESGEERLNLDRENLLDAETEAWLELRGLARHLDDYEPLA